MREKKKQLEKSNTNKKYILVKIVKRFYYRETIPFTRKPLLAEAIRIVLHH